MINRSDASMNKVSSNYCSKMMKVKWKRWANSLLKFHFNPSEINIKSIPRNIGQLWDGPNFNSKKYQRHHCGVKQKKVGLLNH
jgi:hypothetical protein